MKNKFIDIMHSKLNIRISGKSPERLILRLYKNDINVIKIKKRSKEVIEITINYADYDKLLKLNTIYEIKIIDYLGFVKNKKRFFKYYHVLLIFIVCIIGIYFLSNMIFEVQVITNDEEMKQSLIQTLKQYDISKYRLRKNYDYLQKVKDDILERYHDTIDWVELDRVGTKYILKYEPKIIKGEQEGNSFGHIVAKKNAIIDKIYSSSGQIVKNKYSYVKKGDIIISGYIYANEKITDTVKASGKVYGEVWYVTKVTYPFNYYEEKKTGKKKIVYTVKLFNNSVELFNFQPFNDKIVKEDILLKHSLLPISLVKQYQEEVVITTDMNVIEEIKIKAIALGYDKMKKSLKDDEYIISHRVLDSKIIDKGIEMTIFFSVCEDISDYVEIEEKKEVE